MTFPTNRNGCTIYEKTAQNRAYIFIRHQTARVYWEETQSQNDGKDRAPANKAFIAIPDGATDYIPKPGDKVIGELTDAEHPPVTAMTIMTVKDFRYGSSNLQHIEVNAE